MKKAAILLSLCVMLTSGCSNSNGGINQGSNETQDVVEVTVWNYYNGNQKIGFDNLVKKFNDTVGSDKGIIIKAVSQSSINGVVDEVMKSLKGKSDAQAMPDIVALYSDTAYLLDGDYNILADMDNYFTKSELDEYIPGFIEEGRFAEGGPLLSFPISKSVEVLMYNKSDWDKFKEATGASEESFETMEGLVDVSQKYYNWTDNLTPDIPEDGKAFYGRDSLGNYIIISSKQLGQELIHTEDGQGVVTLDKDIFRKLWDNYYIPYINGYFASNGRYRSDDAKTGLILSAVCSTSGSLYFPDSVTREDDITYPIDVVVRYAPTFKDAVNNSAVQQGAGYSVIKSDEATELAAVEFIKWITTDEQNINLSISSGYLPVKKSSCTAEKINKACDDGSVQQSLRNTLLTGIETINNYEMYTSKPFENSAGIRKILENSLENSSVEDREKVVKLIADGKTRQEATAEFSTDEYFDQWFKNLNDKINEELEK